MQVRTIKFGKVVLPWALVQEGFELRPRLTRSSAILFKKKEKGCKSEWPPYIFGVEVRS